MQHKEMMKELVLTGLFAAIIFIMAFSPLGYIPLGVIRATIVQIPVIIGALFCGTKKGAFLGFAFGLTSCVTGTMMPTLTSFIFSPIIAATQIGAMGAVYSTLICFGPRILVGVLPVLAYKAINKVCKSKTVCFAITGVIGSLTNTILVMGGIFLFYKDAYAEAMGVSATAILGIIGTTICVNGVIEAILSGVIVSAVGNVLIRIKPIR
ncbi:MAG: ECF transporter S component [Lachnospiraceae bacterium]|nr:ECF transporter S component [Lachnospiraceae bacterium]